MSTRHSSTFRVPCPLCGGRFRTISGMKIHFASDHPKQEDLIPPSEAWTCEHNTLGRGDCCNECGLKFTLQQGKVIRVTKA